MRGLTMPPAESEPQSYAAHMKIEPTTATPEAVRDSLFLLGQPDSGGTVTLNQQGKLTDVMASLP